MRINSVGGQIYAAKAMFQRLTEFRGARIVHVDGLAASAAPFVAMAGTRIITAPEGEWFIHRAQGVTIGDDHDHDQMSVALRRETESIARIYEKRTKRPATAWLEDMSVVRTFMAAEAKAVGLTDEIAGETSVASATARMRAVLPPRRAERDRFLRRLLRQDVV